MGPESQTAKTSVATSEAKVSCVFGGLDQLPSIKLPFATEFHYLSTKGKSCYFKTLLISDVKPFIVAIIARTDWFVEAGPLHW